MPSQVADDAYGRVIKQTMPYASADAAVFKTQDWTRDRTETTYDILGRVLATQARGVGNPGAVPLV